MSSLYLTSLTSAIKIVPYLAIRKSIKQIYLIQFIQKNSHFHNLDSDLFYQKILNKISNFFNLNFTILSPITYTRSFKNKIVIYDFPIIKIQKGDFISDSLIEIYRNDIACDSTDYYVFSHGISTLKYIVPGYNFNKSFAKRYYIYYLKPLLTKCKILLKLRANFKNLIIFDGPINEIKKLADNFNNNLYNLIIIDNKVSDEMLEISREIFFTGIVEKKILNSKYIIFCPIAEETFESNLIYLSKIIKNNPYCNILIKPHSSDLNIYPEDRYMLNMNIFLIDKKIPLEILITANLHYVYMPMCSAIIDIPHNKLSILTPMNKEIAGLYEREYWPFNYLYGENFFDSLNNLEIL